jgi:hypothetical protein
MQAERIARRKLHLVASGGNRATEMKKIKVGDEVPESGIYRVIHRQHRVPHEVTLLQGEKFPPCDLCDDAVVFKLLRLAPQLASGQGLIVLHRLPVMVEVERDEETAAAAAS